jgi:hypothetical protein
MKGYMTVNKKLRLETYAVLIKALPVRSQAFRSKRKTWESALGKEPFPTELKEIFGDGDETFISRQDIFDEAAKSNANTKKIVYLTILWGYPAGMRDKHFSSIVGDMGKLIPVLDQARQKGIPDWSSHWTDHFKSENKVHGLGTLDLFEAIVFSWRHYQRSPGSDSG